MKSLKIVVLSALALVTAAGAIVVFSLYKMKNEPYERYFFHDQNTLVVYPSGKMRLKNHQTGYYITPKLDRIFRNTNPITVYKLDHKRGYLNQETGEIIIDAKTHNFSYAYEFDPESGLAAVVENCLMGFIDETGEFIIKPQFEYHYASFNQLGFRFRDGYSLIPGRNGKLGIIDTSGEIILEPKYDWISNSGEYKLRIVRLNEENQYKFGLMDSTFSLILPVKFDDIELTKEGIILCENQQKRMVAYSNFEKVVTKQIWDEISPLYYQPTGSGSENCSKVFSGYYRVEMGNKSGLINSAGKLCVKPEWDDIYCLNPTLFEVTTNNNSLLINANGQFIDQN